MFRSDMLHRASAQEININQLPVRPMIRYLPFVDWMFGYRLARKIHTYKYENLKSAYS